MFVFSAVCEPHCQSGGRCVGPNKCQCPPATLGAYCQNCECTFYFIKHNDEALQLTIFIILICKGEFFISFISGEDYSGKINYLNLNIQNVLKKGIPETTLSFDITNIHRNILSSKFIIIVL